MKKIQKTFLKLALLCKKKGSKKVENNEARLLAELPGAWGDDKNILK